MSRRVHIGDVAFDLTDAQVDSLRAQLEVTGAGDWIDTSEAAHRLGVSTEFMREHAAEYGGRKVSDGPKGRWRFPADLSRTPTSPKSSEVSSPPKSPRRRPAPRREGLLEIRGKSPYDREDKKAAPSGAVNATEGLDDRRYLSHARHES